jgi:hypothetical protein
VASIPLPVRIIEEHSRRYHPPALSGEDEQRPVPAVGICRLDGAIVTNAHVLRPDEIHDFGLELRLAIAALQACGALSPLSPVPGQVAALCASLDVTGHGITARPARQLRPDRGSACSRTTAAASWSRPRAATAAPPRPSRFPNWTGPGSRSSACTMSTAAPSCTGTPAV